MHIRIGIPVPPKPLDFRDFHQFSSLYGRSNTNGATNTNSIIIVAVIVALVAVVAGFIIIRTVRSRHPNPRYIPTAFLKRVWTNWKVPSYQTGYSRTHDDDGNTLRSTTTGRSSHLADSSPTFEGNVNRTRGGTTTVDRNTSVRSVMTLPVYRAKAGDNEHVIGREGERDGVDVVVEMPTAEEEEALRDDEMEALYQIRLARRAQVAEREQRRRERQEARDRNDQAELRNIRERARAASASNPQQIEELRAEHSRIRESRQRTVSSVSYGDLGVARLDGSRLRANSTESERVGLLSDAASIALSARSPSSLQHRRERSTSSVLSINTTYSERPGSPSPGLSTGRSRAGSTVSQTTPRRLSHQSDGRAGSSPELVDAPDGDLGGVDIPPHSPPGYDEVSLGEVTPVHSRSTSPYPDPPPSYPGGPAQARNQRLSANVADLAANAAAEDERRQSRSSIPRLPSLRLPSLPQIVIEPSSAMPRDDSTHR